MKVKTPDDNPQVQQGKKIIEDSLTKKDAANFEWSQEFSTRDWTVKFDWNGARYSNSIGHSSLTDFKHDNQKDAKLRAIWENKTDLDK